MITLQSRELRQILCGAPMLSPFGGVYSVTEIVVVANHSLISPASSH
jgi:hypothetical protein